MSRKKAVRRYKPPQVKAWYVVNRLGERLCKDTFPFEWRVAGSAVAFPTRGAAKDFIEDFLYGEAGRKLLGAHVEKA